MVFSIKIKIPSLQGLAITAQAHMTAWDYYVISWLRQANDTAPLILFLDLVYSTGGYEGIYILSFHNDHSSFTQAVVFVHDKEAQAGPFCQGGHSMENLCRMLTHGPSRTLENVELVVDKEAEITTFVLSGFVQGNLNRPSGVRTVTMEVDTCVCRTLSHA